MMQFTGTVERLTNLLSASKEAKSPQQFAAFARLIDKQTDAVRQSLLTHILDGLAYFSE